MAYRLQSIAETEQNLFAGTYDARLTGFYGSSGDALFPYRNRIANALHAFDALSSARAAQVFSVSGRTELGGNHTDHQHGRVLAGGISLDIIAVAAPTDASEIRVQSEGYPEDVVSLDNLTSNPAEYGTSAALIRGIAARFAELGHSVGGLQVYTTSHVLNGSGLSSSAAFEVMIGTICNTFYAKNSFSQVEIAQIAQYAENVYFGKPCGLMDQMACALGGVDVIDFANPATPQWKQIPLDLRAEGYALCIIDSGAHHADLTDAYAAVPAEMSAVAHAMGKEYLRDTDEAQFWAMLPQLREQCSDRAVLRAMHFYADHARVAEQAAALEAGDFAQYLSLVAQSGQSSISMLQNTHVTETPQHQAVDIALALCQKMLKGRGACRVHGGGFAGTIQAYVPLEDCEAFRAGMDAVLGAGACHVLQIRSLGASALWD